MTVQVTNYKCPSCTGPLHYSQNSGRLECDYCGSSFSVEEIEALYAEKEAKAAAEMQKEEEKARKAAAGIDNEAEDTTENANEGNADPDTEAEAAWDTSEINDDWGEDTDDIKVYSCPSCGAELMCTETTAATSCPYCGNPTIIPGKFAGALKPDYVIPFKLTKDDAIKALKRFYLRKPLLPRAFSNKNHLTEIKGVYVPFWLFDGQAKGTVHFNATRSHTHKSGDYEITVTDHYHLTRSGDLAFEKVPVDGSSKMPDDYMDSVEPYDYNELKPFSTAYLPGFLADKYDVGVNECSERADRRCINSFANEIEKTVTGYTTHSITSKDLKLKRGKVHYALLPVWVLNTKWEGQDFLFTVNGQTGKLAGSLPVCKKQALKLYLAVASVLSTASVSLILYMMR